MVDIETLGLEPGSAILSIGAVEFTADGLGDEFHREISLKSCQAAGLEIDAGTLEWWLSQDDAVTGVLAGGGELGPVLNAFYNWYPDGAEVWANSPSFDCRHLEAAFDAVGMTEPWEYYDERDVRTLKSLPIAANVEMDGNEHDALDDAKHQARFAAATLRNLDHATSTEVLQD
ncbi:3'-5' exonuclease [Halobacterium sp. CBA1126]|uniref:3'-5' exonuclease n=1 Tax=Halobacterium sp. CBA1126 TaxID=2668074 RepID=UPI0018D25CD1|nr:3'-5' exonuclease [Halobacterium sp. CBA1126]